MTSHLAGSDKGLCHSPVPAAVAGSDEVCHPAALKEGTQFGPRIEHL